MARSSPGEPPRYGFRSLARDRALSYRVQQANIKYRVNSYTSTQVEIVSIWANNLCDINRS